jgi:hypothetical protein
MIEGSLYVHQKGPAIFFSAHALWTLFVKQDAASTTERRSLQPSWPVCNFGSTVIDRSSVTTFSTTLPTQFNSEMTLYAFGLE